MTARFIVFAWPDEGIRARAEKLALDAVESLGLSPVARSQNAMILAEPKSMSSIVKEDGIIVIGDLFTRDMDYRYVQELDDSAARHISKSAGQDLFTEFWGEYVAVILDGPVRILRDPSGAVPCYYTDCGDGLTAFYSDVDLAMRLGLVPGRIDWATLRQWLAWPAWRSARTCIEAVNDLPAGGRWTLQEGEATIDQAWTPWDFACESRQFTDRRDAVEALQDAILKSTRAWASRSVSPIIELSGGLDSSIVAASLSLAKKPFHCVNLWSPDSGEDERHYAAAVADFLEVPAHSVALAPATFDFADLPPTPRPRPFHHPLKRIADIAIEREARRQGADSFFSGSGGDYVLGYLSSSAPAADALLRYGPGAQFCSAVSDVANLHSCSIWKIGRLAFKKAISPLRKNPGRIAFLAETEGLAPPPPHPWTLAPRHALPGKIEHIGALSKSHGVRNGRDRAAVGALRMPLLAQPVIETSLRISSWMNVMGGRNRAVARDAFAEKLPAEILHRRSKGSFAGLNAQMLRHNHLQIAHLLLGGLLTEKGVLDRAKLEQSLRSHETLSEEACSSLLEFTCVELWARNW